KKGVTPALNILTDDAKQGIAEAQVALGVMHEYGYSFPQDNNEAFKWYRLAADRGKTNVYRIAKKGVTPALNILTDDAKNGIAEAQFYLGVMYENGYQFPHDYNKAFNWYRQGKKQGFMQAITYSYGITKKGGAAAMKILTDDAKNGIAEAESNMGAMYEYGLQFEPDYDKAFNWYRLSAEHGYGSGKASIYRIAKKGVTPALNILTNDAKNGVAEAQIVLGTMHEHGYSFPQDNNEAFKWYRLATDQGYEQGKANIYRIAIKGDAVAMKILTDDAKNGDAKAQLYLGMMYELGHSFPLDNNEAFKWYQLAADQGYEQGKENIYRIAKKGVTPALNILTDDAKNGAAKAQLYLGMMYELGHSFPLDNNEAFKWFQLAANQGYEQGKENIYRIAKKGVTPALNILTDDAKNGAAKAQFYLGMMYELGHSFPLDNNEAFKWFQLAAKQGDDLAQIHLGQMYEKGHVVPQDYNEAVNRYRLVAEKRYSKAQLNLGIMYYKGRGVLQDNVQADMWFILASLQKDQEAIKYISLVEKKMSPQQIVKARVMARVWEP
ncbi:MAG: SEL1-like repeat protein, partial [Nitrospina sp.]|nr:SEL1-like repeat protein [Nitrospina sp.]